MSDDDTKDFRPRIAPENLLSRVPHGLMAVFERRQALDKLWGGLTLRHCRLGQRYNDERLRTKRSEATLGLAPTPSQAPHPTSRLCCC